MNLVDIYKNNHEKQWEKCLVSPNYFVGTESGKLYPREFYYCRPQKEVVIGHVSERNTTGIVELGRHDSIGYKKKFEGCQITVEKSHKYGEIEVYYSPELEEYFTEQEIIFIDVEDA